MGDVDRCFNGRGLGQLAPCGSAGAGQGEAINARMYPFTSAGFSWMTFSSYKMMGAKSLLQVYLCTLKICLL